jgi:opacity protein-like surface antigen
VAGGRPHVVLWETRRGGEQGSRVGVQSRERRNNCGAVSFSGAKNVWGLAAGGGVEWAFNQSWSLKAEYEYLGLRKTVAACGSLPPSAAGAGGPWCTQGGIGGVQSLKAGINYRFNSWPMAAQ